MSRPVAVRRCAVAGLVMVVMGLAPATGAVAAATGSVAHDGPCTDDVGVTVVVDFQELGGGVNIRCSETSPRSGFEALQQAGISYQTTARFPGFLCKIAGQPASDPCQTTSPANAYWSYWVAPRGGQWCYSSVGAGNRTPPPGSVEGWSFALDKTTSEIPPPGVAPPAPVPGTTPSPIPGGHCRTTAASTPPAPPTTSAPTPPTTALQPTPSSPPSGSAVVPPPGEDAGDNLGGPGADASSGTDVAEVEVAGERPARSSRPTSSVAAPDAGPDPQALGDVDLSSDGQGDGSPTGAMVTALVVLALGSGLAWRRRRVRADGG